MTAWSSENPDFEIALGRMRCSSLVLFARTAAGKTQFQLAEALRVSQTNVSKLEDGSFPPRLRTLARVAAECKAVLTVAMQVGPHRLEVEFDGADYFAHRDDLAIEKGLVRRAEKLRQRLKRWSSGVEGFSRD